MTRDEFHNDPVIDADVDRDPVEQLAEEFLDRRRKGESVSIAEYAERHPDLASRISDLFPTLLLMEELRPSATGRHTRQPFAIGCEQRRRHRADRRFPHPARDRPGRHGHSI